MTSMSNVRVRLPVAAFDTYQSTAMPRQEIKITKPDGSVRDGTSWETSPMDIAKAIAKSLSERVVIAKVCQSLTFFLI
jgi:hypothetical protein